MEKLGIVMNSYRNPPNHLITAIKSCLAQQGVDIKLIISTIVGDNAEMVAKSISKNIVVVKGSSPNIYEQLNRGIDSLGDVGWYSFFSGNDFCLPTKANNEINICLKTGKKICNSDYYMVNENLQNRKHILLPEYNYAKHLSGVNFVSDCSMIKIEILKKYIPFVVRHNNYAYYDFWLRTAEGEGNVFANNRNPEWLYRICPTSKHIMREKNPVEKALYYKIRDQMLAEHRALKK